MIVDVAWSRAEFMAGIAVFRPCVASCKHRILFPRELDIKVEVSGVSRSIIHLGLAVDR
jgi:hypothetical protein